jgi:hypothetical protein
MTERIDQEVALLQTAYPGLEWRADAFWARIPEYPVPPGPWTLAVIEVAFRIPPGLPGEAPYAFQVRPGLESTVGGAIGNYAYPVSNPCFGEGWGQFSWSPEEWAPHSEIRRGSNMFTFVRSFADRLKEGP